MAVPPTSTTTARFSNNSLIAARIVGAIMAGFALLVFSLALPAHSANLQSIYAPDIFKQLGLPDSFFVWYVLPFDIAFELVFVVIAVIIFWKRSHDPMALFISVMLIVFAVTFPSAVRSLADQQPVWRWPVTVLTIAADILTLTALYIFPNFHFVPPQTRWWIVGWIIWIISSSILALSPIALPDFLIFFINMSMFASGAWAQIYRYRNSADALQRQQTKWIVFGLSITIAGSYLCDLPQIMYPDAFTTAPGLLYDLFRIPMRLLFATLVPLSIAFSVLRYRLWNIDFVINRALVYGTLTGLLVLLLGGSLFLISRFFQDFAGGPLVAVAVSAAIFGASFQPLRHRLQRLVDQRLYNIQIDYQKKSPTGLRRLPVSLPHTQLGEYQELELIGRGGMAEVYKSIHPTLGLPVAIKIMPATLAADADFRRRFEREAQVIARLQHPNIIHLLDSGTENDTPYMVMEFMAGKDLSAHLRERGRLTLVETEHILNDIATALDYAHAQGLVHRDIKPSNIMLDADRAVLMDFGIAKVLSGHTAMTRTGILGTLDYIAPEQIQASAEVDGRADVYALGIMTYQMLTGELPFRHNNPGALLIAHLTEPPPDPRENVPDLSNEVTDAIRRALAKQPDDRYATAGEFVLAFSNAMGPIL